MRFADVKGHEQVKESLRRMADEGRLPHAILLSGPSGIGKMNLARALAQYIHCRNPKDGDSCGQCHSCQLHAKLNNPDLRFIYPIAKKAKPKKEISEDYAEEWREFLRNHPTMPYQEWLTAMDAGNSQPAIFVADSQRILDIASKYPFLEKVKVFIIWLPEKMNAETANKLLKVLEEPFHDTVFIMVSNSPETILPTVFSRSVRFRMKYLSNEEVVSYLQDAGIANENIEEAARLSGGDLNKALELSRDFTETDTFRNQFQAIMRNAYGYRIADLRDYSNELTEYGREKILRFLSYVSRQIGENYIYNMGDSRLYLLSGEEETFSSRFSPFIHGGNVEDMLKQTDLASRDIERNGNRKMVLFDYFLQLMMLLHRPKN